MRWDQVSEGLRDTLNRGLPEDAVGSAAAIPVEGTSIGVRGVSIHAGQIQGLAVGHGYVAAIPVEKDGPVGDRVVEV
jgi:hypothetical protein